MHFARVENIFEDARRAPCCYASRAKKSTRTMIESTLQGFALLALASIVINTVKWLVRRPVALLLLGLAVGVTAGLIR